MTNASLALGGSFNRRFWTYELETEHVHGKGEESLSAEYMHTNTNSLRGDTDKDVCVYVCVCVGGYVGVWVRGWRERKRENIGF